MTFPQITSHDAKQPRSNVGSRDISDELRVVADGERSDAKPKKNYRFVVLSVCVSAIAVFAGAAVAILKDTSIILHPDLDSVAIALFEANPGPDASNQDRQEYLKRIQQYAVSSPVIDFTGCVLEPRIPLLVVGASYLVVNRDAAAHTVRNVDTELTLHIPAQAQFSVTVTASPGTVARFFCDDAPAGVAVVMDQPQ